MSSDIFNKEVKKLRTQMMIAFIFGIVFIVVAFALIIIDDIMFGLNWDMFHVPESRLEMIFLKIQYWCIILSLIMTTLVYRRGLRTFTKIHGE